MEEWIEGNGGKVWERGRIEKRVWRVGKGGGKNWCLGKGNG